MSDVQASINLLYGNSGNATSVSPRSTRLTNTEKPHTNALPLSNEAWIANATTATGARRQYIVTIQAQKNSLNDSFSVFIFVGAFDDNKSSRWRFEPNLVGTHGFFAHPGPMSSDTTLVTSGTVPLTNALVGRVETRELTGLGSEEVSAYLRQNLGWRIMKVRILDSRYAAVYMMHLPTNSGRWMRGFPQRCSWASNWRRQRSCGATNDI